jgi:hypothetical protein
MLTSVEEVLLTSRTIIGSHQVIAERPAADNLSNRPHIARKDVVRGHRKCVDIVSPGNRARSIARTLKPRLASSIADVLSFELVTVRNEHRRRALISDKF